MKKVFFLMPGQGAQYVGMGKDICEMYPEVEYVYDIANDVLQKDIKKMCFESDIEELTRTENTQIAVFLYSVAAYKAVTGRYNIEPIGFAGHSLGEFSALVCADGLDLRAAICLVEKRGQFMQEVSESIPSKMVAFRNISPQEIEKQCEIVSEMGEKVAIANYNAPNQIVVTGNKSAVDKVTERLSELGAQEIIINVKTPFHTELMGFSAHKFAEEIAKYEIKAPTYEVISNLTGEAYSQEDNLGDVLIKQITNPVKWTQTMEYMKTLDVDLVIDMGPKDIMKKLAINNGVSIPTFAFGISEDLKILKQKYLSPKTVVSLVSKALGIAVSLKNYNENSAQYEEGVIKPYRRIEEIKRTVKNNQDQISANEIHEITNLLTTIFETKKTSVEEREKRMQELLNLIPSDSKPVEVPV